jgi:hypothetical protein
VTCTELQFNRHVVLAVALVVALGTVVVGTPGRRHVVWQFAACELHSIMQAVTFPVWASRILLSATGGGADQHCHKKKRQAPHHASHPPD